MELTLFIIILLFLAGIAWQIFQSQKQKPKDDGQSFLLIQNQIHDQQNQIQKRMDELTKTLDARLGDSMKTMLTQSDKSVQIVKEITSEITKVTEGQKQIVTLNDQLRNLNDILKNTKQRG